MAFRAVFFPMVGIVGVAVGVSCTADQPLIGTPEGLAGRKVPDPSDDPTRGDASALNDTGPPPSSDLTALCGTTPPDPPTGCDPTFWSAKIYPKMTGDWNCALVGCHATGGTPPEIVVDGAEPAKTTWTNLANFTGKIGRRYVNPCSTDPNESGVYCNLNFNPSTCGSPMPQGKTLVAADKTDLETWLKCGARP